jgi:uncharacterized BrkB/YihY/UPF0761 family membrane protein
MTAGAEPTGLAAILYRVDRFQQRHPVLGFPYAVLVKFFDDSGGRLAALMTYYGFLSVFPVLLLGVTFVSHVLVQRPELRHRLVVAMVPASLQSTVEGAAAAMPSSRLALTAGLIGLLLAGTGVVSSVHLALNHLAAVPHRQRAFVLFRYLRIMVGLVFILVTVLALGILTVAGAALPDQPWLSRGTAAIGSAVISFVMLLLLSRLLLERPAPVRTLCTAVVPAAVVVALTLDLGATILPGLVRRAGPVYGSFATVAGMFTLLYVLSLLLVLVAETALVRHWRLWPRAVDYDRPTEADARAYVLLAREQERVSCARISLSLSVPAANAGEAPPASSTGHDDAGPGTGGSG